MEEKQKEVRKITRHEFYFETPLYEFIANEDFNEDVLSGDVDAYNSLSGFDTTYTINGHRIDNSTWETYFKVYKVTLTCKRNGKDILRFFVWKDADVIGKFGQYPSLADIQFAEIGKKYDKLLSRSDLQEFKKAIGLAAHGVGAGSFVYLRRIFENLIKETFAEINSTLGMKEEDFLRLRMEEKVDALAKYLPSQLVEMRNIYKVLSDGVHNLTEEECLTYFPVLKLSIELILEQKIESESKKKKDAEVKKRVAEMTQSLKKKN